MSMERHALIPTERIAQVILLLRGQKVLLDGSTQEIETAYRVQDASKVEKNTGAGFARFIRSVMALAQKPQAPRPRSSPARPDTCGK